MRIELNRSAFEAFAQRNEFGTYRTDRKGDGYDSSHTQLMWMAWCAAIQQAEAQQPDTPSLQAVCRYISDVLGSEAPNGEKHIARTIMHLLPLEQSLSGQQPATTEPVAWLDEMLADTREVFDAGGSETPQVVRDVIEYVKSWVTVYSEKNHPAPAAHPAPSVPHNDYQHSHGSSQDPQDTYVNGLAQANNEQD